MRFRALVAPLAGLVVGVAAWIAWSAANGTLGYEPPSVGARASTAGSLGWPWLGAVHVHTGESGDARGTPEDIARAASALGLDYVVISDHVTAGIAPASRRPRWIDGVLMVVAEEISSDEGHLLALATQPHRYALGPTSRAAVRDIYDLGGAAFVAHPSGGETAWRGGYGSVRGLEAPNLAGAFYQLADGSALAVVRAALTYPASGPAAALLTLASPSPSVAEWIRLTASSASQPRMLSILGAADDHGPRLLGIPGPALRLASVNTMVWLDEAPGDGGESRARDVAAAINRSLIEGRSAVVISAAGTAPNFVFLARRGSTVLGPGAAAVPGPAEWEFVADLGTPGPYRIELLRDGEVVASSGERLSFRSGAVGTYRARVYRTEGPAGAGLEGATPWILSNPIYLWPRRAIEAARLYPAPPPPAPPVTDNLLTRTGWAAEADRESMSAVAPLNGGLRWDLRLPATAIPNAHSAVAWRPEGGADWSAARGISVELAGDFERRVSLRLWIRDGETIQTWERVVAARPDGASTGVPWSSFRALGPGGARIVDSMLSAADLSRIAGIALVVTPQVMRPRTDTSLEVRQLGLYGGVGVRPAPPG